MTKVSTITPCYNMSKYMEGFLDNLSQQTHQDLEVVMDHNDPTEREVELVEAKSKYTQEDSTIKMLTDRKKIILTRYLPITFIYTPIKFNITSFFQFFVTFSSFVSIFILLCEIPWFIKNARI